MTIQSSFTQEAAQKDGRRWTFETHIDDFAKSYVYRYLAEAGDDCTAVMAARAISLPAILAADEINRNVAAIVTDGSLAVVTFNYSTMAQNRAALREAYRDANRLQAVMIGDFLSSLTDNQLATVFNISLGEVTTLRSTKLTPAAQISAAVRAATGA